LDINGKERDRDAMRALQARSASSGEKCFFRREVLLQARSASSGEKCFFRREVLLQITCQLLVYGVGETDESRCESVVRPATG